MQLACVSHCAPMGRRGVQSPKTVKGNRGKQKSFGPHSKSWRQTSGSDTDTDTDADAKLREAGVNERDRLSLGIDAEDNAVAREMRNDSSISVRATRLQTGDMAGCVRDRGDGVEVAGRGITRSRAGRL